MVGRHLEGAIDKDPRAKVVWRCVAGRFGSNTFQVYLAKALFTGIIYLAGLYNFMVCYYFQLTIWQKNYSALHPRLCLFSALIRMKKNCRKYFDDFSRKYSKRAQ